MDRDQNKRKEIQGENSVYQINVEPIIVDEMFVCYVHGAYFEDYYATYRRNPNEIVKEYLLSKGSTIREGLAAVFRECESAGESLSYWITDYLDTNEKGKEYDEELLIKAHEMRRTPQHEKFLEDTLEKYPLLKYPCE